MYLETNVGIVQILDIDESSRKIAEQPGDNWDAGEEVILAEVEGYGYKWVATKHIKY